MDFHTLARRDLQALCKKNKIPANISNVDMADALKALEFVEGIEGVMKPLESETSEVESPEKSDLMMSSAPRTGRITAVRKTAKKGSEISQTMTRTRRSTRKIASEISDETKNEVALETPAAPTGRRRRAAMPKMETMLKECLDNEENREQILHEKKDLIKTPGTVMTSRMREVKEKSSVCQGFSTRRSARLAAKVYGSSIQETEASKNGTCGSLTVEDGVVDINSKLRSLHLDEEHETVDSTSASGGIENQSLAGKEMTTNGLDDIFANVELSSGSKESNDVEMDLQEGTDLKLKCREAVADNKAVSEKLGDDDDKPEVPYTGEITEYVVENADALYSLDVVDSSVFCENENESLVRKEVNVEMHKSSEDLAILEIANKLSDIYDICKEKNDAGTVMQEGDKAIQLECQEVFGDDMSKVLDTSEISECVVENADALCNTEVLLVADSTTCLSVNENQTLANDEQNVVDTHLSSEMQLEECVVKNADEPNTNEICGGVMVQPWDDGENVEDETSYCLVKEDEEVLLLSKQFGDDTNIIETPSDSDPAVEEGEKILLSKQAGNDTREKASESEESEGVLINLQVDTTPMDDEISDGEKDLLQSKELGKMSSDSEESQEQGVVINLQADITSIDDKISDPAVKEDDKVLLLSRQLGNDGNISETASHSEEPEEGVIINLQVDTTSINVEISNDEKDPLLSKDVIINPPVEEDVGDNDGKKKSNSNNTTGVDEGKDSAMFDQEVNAAETFLVVPQQPSISTLVLFSDDKENIDTRESMKLDLTKKKKEGNNLDEMSIRQLCKKLKELNPYHSQQVEEEEHEDDDGAPPFRARNSKKQKWRKGRKTFVAQRTAENRPALQQVPHNCLVGNSKNSSH